MSTHKIDTHIKLCCSCENWKHARNFNHKYQTGSFLNNICRVCEYRQKAGSQELRIKDIVESFKELKCIGKVALNFGIPYTAVLECLKLNNITIPSSQKPLRDWNSLKFKEQWEIVTRMKSNQL